MSSVCEYCYTSNWDYGRKRPHAGCKHCRVGYVGIPSMLEYDDRQLQLWVIVWTVVIIPAIALTLYAHNMLP